MDAAIHKSGYLFRAELPSHSGLTLMESFERKQGIKIPERVYFDFFENIISQISDRNLIVRLINEYYAAVNLHRNNHPHEDSNRNLMNATAALYKSAKNNFCASENSFFTFSDLTLIRQRNYDSPAVIQEGLARPILRINEVPFFESVYLHELKDEIERDSNCPFSLDIIDIPWGKIGRALLNRQIDVAAYNDSLEQQVEWEVSKSDRSTFLSSKKRSQTNESQFDNLHPIDLFEYNRYFILHNDEKGAVDNILIDLNCPESSSANRLFKFLSGKYLTIVPNSDFQSVLERVVDASEWKFVENANGEVETITHEGSFENIRVIGNPDADNAVSEFANDRSSRSACMAGGVHKAYLTDEFPDLFKTVGTLFWPKADTFNERIVGSNRTICRLWFPRTPEADTWISHLAKAWASIATKFVEGTWTDEDYDRHMLYVNRQDRAAFLTGRAAYDDARACSRLLPTREPIAGR